MLGSECALHTQALLKVLKSKYNFCLCVDGLEYASACKQLMPTGQTTVQCSNKCFLSLLSLSLSSTARGRGSETYRGSLPRAGNTQLADMLSKYSCYISIHYVPTCNIHIATHIMSSMTNEAGHVLSWTTFMFLDIERLRLWTATLRLEKRKARQLNEFTGAAEH